MNKKIVDICFYASTILIFIALCLGLYFCSNYVIEQGKAKSKIKAEKTNERMIELCTNFCENRDGMSHWLYEVKGWTSWQPVCICKDATMVPLPHN